MSRDWTQRAVVPILGVCLLLYLSGSASAMFDLEEHDQNRVLMPVTNYGPFGQDISGSAGTYWPQGTGMAYVFGAGLWIGALRGNDTLVSVGYNCVDGNFEFYPGPPEHNADHMVDPQSHPEDRVYMSTDPADTAEWPLRDSTGAKIILSEQDSYCLSNDGKQFEGDSIGILVTRHGLVWNSMMAQDMVFFMYTIRNYGADPVGDMYAGAAADNDVGYADDDLLGVDRDLELGYTYTPNQEPGWPAPPPYYVGYILLQGPRASDTVRVGPDTTNPDTVIYPGEHLVMTAFKKSTRNIEPGTDPARYMFLAGYDFTTGDYNPFDTLDTEPEDKRQLLSAGPFSLVPDQVDTFAFAVVFANGNTGGLDRLRELAKIAQYWYDNFFVGVHELVTGGGWIPGDPLGPGNKRTFGFNVHAEAGATGGNLQFNDHGMKLKVHADTVETLTIHEGDTVASFSGKCRVSQVGSRVGPHSFECEVMDGGEPGRGVDSFSIDVYDEHGNLYYSAGDFLGGGNIQIHISPGGDATMVEFEPEVKLGDDLNPLPKTENETQVLPMGQRLSRNSPNPFRSSTVISYQLPSACRVTLNIYDLTGTLVTTLVSGTKPAGRYTIEWDGKDSMGRRAASGVYFYRLEAGDFTATKKLVLLR